jgi:hypothetical protein
LEYNENLVFVKTLPARNESDFLQNDFSITSNVFWIEQAAPEIHRVLTYSHE